MCSKKLISKWLLMLVAPALFLAVSAEAARAVGSPDAPPHGGDFTLHSAAGPVALSDLRGKVVLLFFGYTACPDVCPLSLAKMSACFHSLDPAELDRTAGLFVTLDPERDTPARIGEYTAFFHPNIIGLTGPVEEIDAVTARYGVRYQRQGMPESALGYSIAHPPHIFMIDANGRLAGELPDDTDVTTLKERVRALLATTD